METIFSKIIAGKMSSVKVHEDDVCVAILDVRPMMKGHMLIISRKEYPNIASCPDDVLAHMIAVVKKADAKLRAALDCDGTNILINNDPASGQEVPHLHIHVIPRFEGDGKNFRFSREQYDEGEMVKLGKKLTF